MRITLLAAAAIACVVAVTNARPQVDPNHETRTPDVPGMTVATSLCAISDDATYGLSAANPIKVGGGVMQMVARELRYLNALRGPTGQGVHFKRQGSTQAPDGDTVLDRYVLDYTDIEKPVSLYIDVYHWDTPKAPKGWLCGVAMNLDPPGPDPQETNRQRMTLAIGLGDQAVEPISADPDGSKAHGFVYDHMRLIGLAARAAAASGKPLKVESLSADVRQQRTIVIALPMTCEGKTIKPEAVTLSDSAGNAPQMLDKAGNGKIADMAPGLTDIPDAIGISYGTPGLIDGARINIRYAAPCGTQSESVVLPVKSERGRLIKSVPGVIPEGVTVPAAGAQVRVQVFLSADGTPLFPAYLGGPAELRDAAVAAAKEWRVEPSKMNGAPLLQTSTLAITFRPPR